MRALRLSAIVLVALLFGACSESSPPAAPTEPSCNRDLLQRFDRVRVTGAGVANVELEIDSGGSIDIPGIGRLTAVGTSAAGLSAIVTDKLNAAAPSYAIDGHAPASVVIEKLPPAHVVRVVGDSNVTVALPWGQGMTARSAARAAAIATAPQSGRALVLVGPCMTQKSFQLDAGDDVPVHPGDVVLLTHPEPRD